MPGERQTMIPEGCAGNFPDQMARLRYVALAIARAFILQVA